MRNVVLCHWQKWYWVSTSLSTLRSLIVLFFSRKTTSMLFKILAIQRAWERVPDTPKPRQLFVTKSPILAAKVEECFTNLVDSLALAGCSEEDLRRLKSCKGAKKLRSMIDPLDALDCRPGMPQKYSGLGDHDFPLFITFDQVRSAWSREDHY